MPYGVVREFERRIAEYAGSKYAVAVESGSAALFLSCCYFGVKDVVIPRHTYPSVPCAIIHAGGHVCFGDQDWQGTYKLEPYEIVDGALRFRRGMYENGLHCISFSAKKHLAIGRGGMILTDSADADKWLRLMRYDGREEIEMSRQKDFTVIGWNFYMQPEQAARGLLLFHFLKNKELPDLRVEDQGYPDLGSFEVYRR